MKLLLFGADIDLPFDGPVGGLANRATVTLRADQKSVNIVFEGALPQASARFDVVLPCAVAKERVHLGDAVVTDSDGELDVRPPLGFTPFTVTEPRIVSGPAVGPLGIAFEDRKKEVRKALLKVHLEDTLSTAEWGSEADWSRLCLGFSLPDQATVCMPRPGGTNQELRIRDVLNTSIEMEPGPQRIQNLGFVKIVLASDTIQLLARPSEHALFIHPDVLDTRDALARGNEILYQYALVNGLLEIRLTETDATVHQFAWIPTGDADHAGVLLFRLKDEHGHPLLFEAPRLPLQQRRGLTIEVKDDPPPNWELTLAGIVPAAGPLSGRLRALDPTSVDLLSGDCEKRWLRGASVVAGTAPIEIHGLARGAFLERTGDNPDSLPCQMTTENVPDDHSRCIFAMSTVHLKSAPWTLRAQVEERDVYPGLAAAAAPGPVGVRSASASEGQTFALPTIDTSFALANLAGERVAQGLILDRSVAWLRRLDAQFAGTNPTVFKATALSTQTHVSGFGFVPPDDHPFQSVLEPPPGLAVSAAATARRSPSLLPRRTDYVHGGERSQPAFQNLRNSQTNAAAFGNGWRAFVQFWNRPGASPARAALREHLGEKPPVTLDDVDSQRLLDAALERLYGSIILDGFDDTELQNLRTQIPQGLDVAAFKQLWAAKNEPLRSFLDALWSPAGTALYRRAVSAVHVPPNRQLPASLAPFAAPLQAAVVQVPAAAVGALQGFLTPTTLGQDGAFGALQRVWRSAALLPLRRRHGFEFALDVYQRLLLAEFEDDLRQVFVEYGLDLSFPFEELKADLVRVWALDALGGLRAKYGDALDAPVFANVQKVRADLELLLTAQKALAREVLARINVAPPEYLFLTRRFPTVGSSAGTAAAVLWNHRFQLAQAGAGNLWYFLLDSDSSVVVKLGGQRGLVAILEEIEAAYVSADRPNPLGLSMPLAKFVERLDPEVVRDSWRGILIVNPTADISDDETLTKLVGFSHIPIVYVALGGARPESEKIDLDVYANIFEERAPESVAANAAGDVALTLLKFDASIRNTRLAAGEIVLQLKVRNLWGRDESTYKFDEIMVRGTLPREKAPGDASARGFEFAAWLPKPAEFKVDIAFVKSFVIRAVRVRDNKGQAAMEIDGDVLLQKWDGLDLGGGSFDIGPEPGEGDPRINLQDFRILIPDLPDGQGLRMGLARLLNFEFPAVNFTLPKPRPLNVWGGIELKPFAIGFVRNVADASKSYQELRNRYRWLKDLPKASDLFQLPYLRCEIDFGKLPQFGGLGLSRLKFDLIIGLVISKLGEPPTVSVGIAGFDGKDIDLNLFGLLRLEIERLALARYQTTLDQPPRDVVALRVEKPRLTILGWSPLPDASRIELMMLQAQPRPGRGDGRGVLGWYAQGAGKGFFRLYWLLLAHGVAVEAKVLNYLLNSKADADPKKLLPKLEEGGKLKATVTDDDSWLFGISFGLGDIIDQGTLVLHDQHYYGISLRGPAVKLLFATESLELAYIPGATRDEDRFRTSLRIPALDLLGPIKSGEIALEWAFNWNFLLDFGFPWRQGAAYQWERSFSVPVGTYEAKFGVYFERRMQPAPSGAKQLVLSAGVAFYLGYYVGFGSPGRWVWAQAGIGIFAILEGQVTFEMADGANGALALKGSIREVLVRGVIGIYAYGDGGIEIWVISARFRVSVQAAIAGELHYLPHANSTLSYAATLSAHYSASCSVGCGWFSFTFSVAGQVDFLVSGQLLLN